MTDDYARRLETLAATSAAASMTARCAANVGFSTDELVAEAFTIAAAIMAEAERRAKEREPRHNDFDSSHKPEHCTETLQRAQREINRLLAVNDSLKRQNAALRGSDDKLRDENSALMEQLKEQKPAKQPDLVGCGYGHYLDAEERASGHCPACEEIARLKTENAALKVYSEGIAVGKCGHMWSERYHADQCPTCAQHAALEEKVRRLAEVLGRILTIGNRSNFSFKQNRDDFDTAIRDGWQVLAATGAVPVYEVKR